MTWADVTVERADSLIIRGQHSAIRVTADGAAFKVEELAEVSRVNDRDRHDQAHQHGGERDGVRVKDHAAYEQGVGALHITPLAVNIYRRFAFRLKAKG